MLNEIAEILTKIPENDIDKFVSILSQHKSNRIWLIGNGGSASCASHFASDLESLQFDTKCLSDNQSRITAITNDYGWDDVYWRQLHAMKANDVLISISVHGGDDDWSCNLKKAAAFASGRGAIVLSLTGFDGGFLLKNSHCNINVPAENTFQIEGIHAVLTHVIWKKLEKLK